MKKALSVILALTLCLGCMCAFAGCTAQKDDGKYTIGIVQLVEHVALDAATEGFKQAIIDELGADAVEFDFQNGQNDLHNFHFRLTSLRYGIGIDPKSIHAKTRGIHKSHGIIAHGYLKCKTFSIFFYLVTQFPVARQVK